MSGFGFSIELSAPLPELHSTEIIVSLADTVGNMCSTIGGPTRAFWDHLYELYFYDYCDVEPVDDSLLLWFRSPAGAADLESYACTHWAQLAVAARPHGLAGIPEELTVTRPPGSGLDQLLARDSDMQLLPLRGSFWLVRKGSGGLLMGTGNRALTSPDLSKEESLAVQHALDSRLCICPACAWLRTERGER